MSQSLNYRPRPVPVPPPAPTPLIAPTGHASLDAMASVVNKAASPFQSAPPPEQGTLGAISQGVSGVLGAAGAPFELLDTGFALATAKIAALVPGMPAATLTAPHIGMPHGHMHPPSLIPPAPTPIPLPSLGMVAAAGCVSVLIGGMPAARASDVGPAPTCGSLGPIFEVYTGSSNTFIGGSRAARMTDITRHCNPASALGVFGKAMGAVGVAAGALGAGAEAAGGNMAAAAMQAAQAAADAVALAMAAFLGKDPGVPPAMGALMFGVPTVLIGGFPMPDTLEALGGLLKAAKKVAGGAKKLGSKAAKLRSQVCLDPSEPVSLITGEVYNDFDDLRFDPRTGWAWVRHYRSGWADRVGPMGRGFRHIYERRLELRRRRAVFVDYNGVEVDFPRSRDDEAYGGVAFGFRLEQVDALNFALRAPDAGVRYWFRRSDAASKEARLVEIRPSRGAPLSLEYDAAGRLLGLWRQDPSGSLQVRLRYDAHGRIVAVERLAPNGSSVQLAEYAYDAEQCLIGVKNVRGGVYAYGYTSGRLTRAEDPRGYGFTWKYDHLGRCIASAGDDGLWGAALEYHTGKTLVTEADGGVWTFFHNDDGVITSVLDPAGGVKQYRLDDSGRISSQIDPAGLVTRWLYDADGHHYARLDPWGAVVPPENDDPDPPTGRELAFPADPRETQLGNLPVPPAPIAFRSDLDRVNIPEPLRASVAAVLHAAQQTRSQPEEVFDVAGQVVLERDACGNEVQIAYSPLGEPAATSDADGRTSQREYGSWSLVLSTTDPTGAVTRYDYDHRERIRAITDPRGHTVRYVRDACGRLEQIWNAEELEERYTHDVAGRLVATFDGGGKPLVEYTYGKHGLCESRKQAGGDVHRYAYDTRGNLIAASSNAAQVELGYDIERRLVRDERDGKGVSHRFRGRKLVATTWFERFSATYRYAPQSFTVLTTPDGGKHRIRALPGGSVERIHANGSHELSHYDGRGRCSGRYLWRHSDDRALWYARYTYSRAGDLQRVEDAFRGATELTYDAAHRVVGLQRSKERPVTFRYDASGNIVQNQFYAWLNYDARNRLVEANGETFVYDRRYHLAEHRRRHVTTRYEYDGVDRLARVSWSDGRPDWRAAYDGLGRRLYKEQGGRRTEFFWDDARLAAELSPEGALRLYVYSGPNALSPVAFVDYDGADAEPTSGRAFYVFYDQVGVPSHIQDTAGAVVWLARHVDPYGFADIDPAASVAFHLRFPGHFFDPETGLHYNRFRYYSPTLGRYLQSDPLGQAGGVNVYAYPHNPLVEVDVFGLAHKKGNNKSKPNKPDKTGPSKKGPGVEDAPAGPSKKRGDHVFANGLRKAPGELRRNADASMLPDNQRARMHQAADEIDDALSDPALHATVDKGPTPAGGDAQSRDFGDANQEFRQRQEEFINAAEEANTAPPSQRDQARQNLQGAADNLNDSWKKMVDSAEDPEAANRVDSATRDAGRNAIQKTRQSMSDMTQDIIDDIFPPGGAT